MDIATMVAINNLNMMTMMQAMQQRQNVITILSNGKEERIMEGSMLDQYIGKECVVSLFNEVGAIKGKSCTVSLFNEVGAIKGTLMEADSQWIKVDAGKKGIQLINQNMVRNITFDNK